jgi:hypothetical protein
MIEMSEVQGLFKYVLFGFIPCGGKGRGKVPALKGMQVILAQVEHRQPGDSRMDNTCPEDPRTGFKGGAAAPRRERDGTVRDNRSGRKGACVTTVIRNAGRKASYT